MKAVVYFLLAGVVMVFGGIAVLSWPLLVTGSMFIVVAAALFVSRDARP